MILTCPECSTKYMAKDGSIGPNGRTVHCARCEAVWFVEGADPDRLALEDNKIELIAPQPVIESSLAAEVEAQRDLPFEASSGATSSAVGAHVLLRDKADATKLASRKRTIGLIWTIPILALIGVAALAIGKRQTLVEIYPKSASFYQAVGLKVKANGLDIQNLTSERLLVDGEEILRVKGEVVNLTSQAKTSPLVQFRLVNRSGEALVDWFVEPGTVPAKSFVEIETDYPAPPVDGVELNFRFNPEDE